MLKLPPIICCLIYHGIIVVMHHYSRYISRTCRQYVMPLVVAYVVMHAYALYMSTKHAIHGMPPMCQLCAVVKNYKNSIVNTVKPVFELFKPEYIYFYTRTYVDLIVSPLYHARAPPL